MYIRKLKLNNFRNYSLLELELGQGICIFVGKNAQGKTNLLESCCLVSMARSHRTSRDRDMIMLSKEHASVAVECVERDGVHTVEICLTQSERKRIRVNGLPCKRVGDMMGQIKTVVFSPEDLDLVKNGPAFRRRYADIYLSQVEPVYFYQLTKYMQVLKERNELLKQMAFKPDEASLEVFDEMLAQAAVPVIEQRSRFIQRLDPVCREIHLALSGNTEELKIEYAQCSQSDAEGIIKGLASTRSGDIKRGSTHVGPHHDDIAIKLNGTDLRFYGSQGQQRTVALSLKLAQLELMSREIGESPILLLDDVLSELDPIRQRHLLNRLTGMQTIITTTHIIPELASVKNKTVYTVNNGNVKRSI